MCIIMNATRLTGQNWSPLLVLWDAKKKWKADHYDLSFKNFLVRFETSKSGICVLRGEKV